MKNKMLWLAFVLWFWAMPVWAQEQAQPSQGVEFVGAVLKEQNVTFAVVLVKSAVLDDKNFADNFIQTLEPAFGGIPVVLMVQDTQGTPGYYGRQDIAQYLSSVPVQNIPWKKYALKQQGDK